MPSDAQKPAANPLGTRPVGRLLMQFSIPSIISFLVSALYNIVDQIFIGQGVGLLGNAATNVAFPLTTISTALALLIGIGTAANFNLNLGAGRQDRAREIAGSGIVFLVSFGVLLGVVVLLFLRPLLIAFGATEEVLSLRPHLYGHHRLRACPCSSSPPGPATSSGQMAAHLLHDLYPVGGHPQHHSGPSVHLWL